MDADEQRVRHPAARKLSADFSFLLWRAKGEQLVNSDYSPKGQKPGRRWMFEQRRMKQLPPSDVVCRTAEDLVPRRDPASPRDGILYHQRA
nr:unnamed protein product [Digitaria exilis]